jgi:hypothetical protein
MAVQDEIYLDNDYYIEVGPIIGLSTTTGAEVLMAGWTDVKAKLCVSADWDDTGIDPSLVVTLDEEIISMAGTGVYRGSFEGSNLSSHLDPTYLDVVIYLHLYRAQDYHVVSPVTVRTGRTIA